MNRMACVLALATGTGLLFGPTGNTAIAEPTPAAASGLQIAVASNRDAANATLDVSFRGGNIHTIELFLDGTLIKKQALDTHDGRGVVSFALDGVTDGSHDVLVKAFDVDGNCATATTVWKIAGTQAELFAHFVGIKANVQVQGVYPIQIAIDASVHNPYVTFKIDNDFLAFMNYAPYTYNWDTTKATNGQHTVGVEVLDGDSLKTVQTLSLLINVNNPGGLTKIHHDDKLPAPAKVTPSTPVSDITKIARSVAESSLPNVRIEPQTTTSSLSRIGMEFAAPSIRAGHAPTGTAFGIAKRMNTPAPRRPEIVRNTASKNVLPDAQNAAPTIDSVLEMSLHPATLNHSANAAPLRSVAPATHSIGRNYAPVKNANHAHSLNSGLLTELASPATLFRPETQTAVTGVAGDLSRVSLSARRAGNVAARPGFMLNPASAQRIARAVHPAMQAAQTVTKLVIARPKPALKLAKKRKPKMFAEFNNAPVDFDVPTRTEAGIPLTPFRQIFEFTGGTIDWNDATQTVHAVNSANDILFKIGATTGVVNDKNVTLEKRPYVDHGRAIVPVSFIRDSMNVTVHFDPKTGHLLIESKK